MAHRDVLTGVLLFGFTVSVAFTFAFEPTATKPAPSPAGCCGSPSVRLHSGIEPRLARETANDCLAGLRLAPPTPAPSIWANC
jgi:hypothetical protein